MASGDPRSRVRDGFANRNDPAGPSSECRFLWRVGRFSRIRNCIVVSPVLVTRATGPAGCSPVPSSPSRASLSSAIFLAYQGRA
jgi:hypothetical protein